MEGKAESKECGEKVCGETVLKGNGDRKGAMGAGEERGRKKKESRMGGKENGNDCVALGGGVDVDALVGAGEVDDGVEGRGKRGDNLTANDYEMGCGVVGEI